MKPCWKDCGLTPEGARSAQLMVDTMTAMVRAHGYSAAKCALNEAQFRAETLPTRTKAYQRKYRKDNSF